MIRHRSLFSGIEGFGLGFALAGLPVETVEVVEIDPFAQRILRARLPRARIVADVREVGKASEPAEWLTAGFPCQPVSQAGKGLAQKDERWLWPETARIIDETKPELVFLENVRGLLAAGRGMGDVLRDLAEIGYGAQWDLIPALAVGAPHLRHRVFVVAYPEAKPLGRVFDWPPWIFPWPSDPAERRDDTRIPRLIRNVPNRRERLTRLGNAVVPQVVASVAIQAVAAMTAEPISPPRLIPDPWPDAFPKAGALVNGDVFKLDTSVSAVRPARYWPTPSAQESGWTLDAIAACVDAEGAPARDPHKRFYHPETATAVAREETGRTREAETLWQTPTAAPWSHGGGGGELVSQVNAEQGEETGGWSRDGASPDDPGRSLNPRWVEWLMGYPDGWTDPEASTSLTVSVSPTEGGRP